MLRLLPYLCAFFLVFGQGYLLCAQTQSPLNPCSKTPILEANAATLTCREPTALLTARVADDAETVIWWEKPNGDLRIGLNCLADSVGVYKVNARTTSDGCLFSKEVLVTDGRMVPWVVSLGDQLTCREPKVTLHTAAFPPRVSFQWHGPNQFYDSIASPMVHLPGVYTLTVTEPKSGCMRVDTAIVTDGRILPTAVATAPQQMDYSQCTVALDGTGSSTGPAFIYLWWASEGHMVKPADSIIAEATQPDVYTLSVTNTLNGCTAKTTIEVQVKDHP